MIISYFRKYLRQERGSNPFLIQNGRFKNGQLPTVYRPGWTENAFLSDTSDRDKVSRDFVLPRLNLTVLIMAFLVLVLAGRTAWLQVIKGQHYYALAENNRLRSVRLEPKRGIIYDRTGRPLVRNQANFLLYAVPADLPDDPEKAQKIYTDISSILGDRTISDLASLVEGVSKRSLEAYRPVSLAENIEYEKALRLYLAAANWPGVTLATKARREYPVYFAASNTEPELSLSHILGYTGKISPEELKRFGEEYLPIDYIGKMGIEYFWENELKGKSGQKRIEVDALGKEKKVIGQTDAIDGNNLVLSLDAVLQAKLEAILSSHLDRLKLKRAAAVILDPKNGEVLALVSLPAYDNNSFARGISALEYQALLAHPDRPLFNRAISGEYPSGSTIKPLILAAALEDGIVSEYTTVVSTGGIRIGEWYFPDWRAGGHGVVSARRAIAESVNTYFYYIGGGYEDFRGLGADRIAYYGRLFGLGAQTGIDLAGERPGLLPTREWKEQAKGERWYIGDTYHLAIGQGDLLVTPLQVAVYTAAIANGGALYRPHLVRQVLDASDKPVRSADNQPVREGFIKPANIRVVREGMRQTVQSGSARSLSTLPVATAGKTGTAQWSSKQKTHAWYTGFAPFDNPELAFAILIEEGGEGSETAVPVAREFLDWYFREFKDTAVDR